MLDPVDPVAQSCAWVDGEFSNVRVDQLPSYPTVPLGRASTDVINQRHRALERN